LGAFEKNDPVDVLCLTSIYFESIKADLDSHHKAMRLKKNKKDTNNPNYPIGTQRRCSLYSHGFYCGTALSESEINAVAEVGAAHFRGMQTIVNMAAKKDPLESEFHRDIRSKLLEEVHQILCQRSTSRSVQ
jgi:hypothetical protein